jgi:hypothetical protein
MHPVVVRRYSPLWHKATTDRVLETERHGGKETSDYHVARLEEGTPSPRHDDAKEPLVVIDEHRCEKEAALFWKVYS